MGKKMMEVDVFNKSIMKLHQVLQPYGISIFNIIMNSDSSTFDNPQNSFIGITAIQVNTNACILVAY